MSMLYKTYTSSSQIDTISYDTELKNLEIKFKVGGSTYRYKDVPIEIWDKCTTVTSIGKFVNSDIKGKFEFTKI